MSCSSCSTLDAFKARNPLKNGSGSACGVVGSVVLVSLLLFFCIPQTVAFLGGIFYQSLFYSQLPSSNNLYIPATFRTAIVFFDKSTQAVANHTHLRTISTFKAFLNNVQGASYKDGVQTCNPDYFSGTINAVTLTDCFTFPDGKIIQFISSNTNPTSFGFQTGFACANPFSCNVASAAYTNVTNNFADVFANYTFTLYFTAKVFTPPSHFQDQLFSISSNQWSTPYTVTSDVSAELLFSNVTVSNNILPWRDTVTKTGTSYHGIMQGRPVPYSNTYNAPPKASFYTGDYHVQYYIYYEKIDKLLGIIGGAIFLGYLIFYFFFHFVNSSMYRMKIAEELIVQHFHDEEDISKKFRAVEIQWSYLLKRIFQPLIQGCSCLRGFRDERMEIVMEMLDLGNLIKSVKISMKNAELSKMAIYNKERRLLLDEAVRREDEEIIDSKNSLPMAENSQSNILENTNNDSKARIASLALLQEQNYKGNEKLSQTLNLDIEVLKTLRNPNDNQLVSVNPTVQALTNSQQYKQSIADMNYSKKVDLKRSGNCLYNGAKAVVDFFSAFFRYVDAFIIKPSFSIDAANTTCGGYCMTFLILCVTILLSVMTMVNMQNNTFEIMESQTFEEPQSIDYSITTGQLFQPFLCFSNSAAVNKFTQVSPTMNLSFIQTTSSGTTLISSSNLAASAHSSLGIYPGSPYSSIATENCFVMNGGNEIKMGGLGTSKQAYWSIRIEPYCSGTQNFCEVTNLAALQAEYAAFESTFYSTLYIPFNTYNTTSHKLTTLGYYAQDIRKGTSNFVVTNGVLETVYVDETKLIDRYSTSFMSRDKVLNRTITASRHQQDANVEGVQAVIPYKEIRIRPSGRTTEVVLIEHSIAILFSIFGGVGFILFIIFRGCFSRYAHYKARLYQARQVYHEDNIYQNASFLSKLWTAFNLPVFQCCGGFYQNVRRMRILDKRIEKDNDVLEVVKQVHVIKELSTAGYKTNVEKRNALIYFKEAITVNLSAGRSNEGPRNHARNGDVSGDDLANREDIEDHEESSSSNSSNRPLNQLNQQGQLNMDDIEVFDDEQHRSPKGKQREEESKGFCSSIVKYFDFFRTTPELTLNGQWRVGSCFGGCLTVILVIIVLLMSLYAVSEFGNRRNRTVSHNQYMITDTSLEPGLTLDSTNFRIALGFYIKPNVSFVDVSNFVNTTSNLGIKLTQTTLTRDPNNNNFVTQANSTAIHFVPCSSTYFDGFKDSNTDYSFMSNLQNAFCLPTTETISLSPSSNTVYKYSNIQIYDRTSNASTQLITFLNTYIVGLFMTVPIIDLDTNTFKHSVQQIRGQHDAVSKSFRYNLTLTKQELQLQLANYTISNQIATRATYNYLTPINPHAYVHSTSSGIISYSITLSFRGLVDSYNVKNKHFVEVFGLVGGLLAFLYLFASILGQSFNTFKMKYLVGKQLYLPVRKKSVRTVRGRVESEEQVDSDFNELYVFIAWSLSWLPNGCRTALSQSINTIWLMAQKAEEEELNYFEFSKKLRKLKDTMNNYFKLKTNANVKATNMFVKIPYVFDLGAQTTRFTDDINFEKYLNENEISSYDKNMMRKLNKEKMNINGIFADPKVREWFSQGKLKDNIEPEQNFFQAYPSGINPKLTNSQRYKPEGSQEQIINKTTTSKNEANKSVHLLIQDDANDNKNRLPVQDVHTVELESRLKPSQAAKIEEEPKVPGKQVEEPANDKDETSSEERIRRQKEEEQKKKQLMMTNGPFYRLEDDGAQKQDDGALNKDKKKEEKRQESEIQVSQSIQD